MSDEVLAAMQNGMDCEATEKTNNPNQADV